MQRLEDLLDQPYRSIARKLLNIDQIPTYEELKQLFIYLKDERIIGEERHDWITFCHRSAIYHALCLEFSENLAKEIRSTGVDEKVVEICAGNGKLSHWLRQFGVNSKAIDNYRNKKISRKPEYVERSGVMQALQKYNPELVIGCWIPFKSTVALRALSHPSVRYYIDIGVGYGDCTGTEKLWQLKKVVITNLGSVEAYSVSRADFFESGDHSFVYLFEKGRFSQN